METTLDLNLQIAAENALAYYIENLKLTASENEGGGDGRDAEGGAVVAIDVKTGQVLVKVSEADYETEWQDIGSVLPDASGVSF